nr:carbohydrate porin [uncultured Rhodopila sp.]
MNKVRYGSCPGAAAAICLLSGIATPVYAQGTPSASPFDPVINFGQTLKNNGVFMDLSYVQDVTGNVNGGKETGWMPIGNLAANAVFDLQTILGIPGASIHIGFSDRNGIPVGAIAGSPAGLLQSDQGPAKFRLSWFYWEQGFDNDRLDITAGRVNPTFDFAFSSISCSFVGVICAQPTSWYFNNGSTPYPSATNGGRVNFQVTPEVYIRAGIYQHADQNGDFTNAGWNWAVNSAGAFYPVEIGYQTSAAAVTYPAKYDVGFYYDSSSYTKADGTAGGRGAFWAQFQQAVWRPAPNSPQILNVFGGALIYNGNSPQWGQYYLGIYDQAPFYTRPRDTIGFIASLYTNNSDIHPNQKTQTMFELNYGFSAIPGITIKPYTQYVIAPTNAGAPIGSTQPKNAWLIGVQFVIDLAQAFEWPQFIPH